MSRRLTIPSPVSGGAAGIAGPTEADPLVLAAARLLDSAVPVPLAAQGWSKVAWLDKEGLSSAIRIEERRERDPAALRRLRARMSRHDCAFVRELPFSAIVEVVRSDLDWDWDK